MNAPTFPARIEAAPRPTLEQRLRFVTLSIECAKEAHRRMPTRGGNSGADERLPPRNMAREDLIDRLRIEAMEREGLPLSLLPDRAPLHSFADIGEGARHPLQSTIGMGGAL